MGLGFKANTNSSADADTDAGSGGSLSRQNRSVRVCRFNGLPQSCATLSTVLPTYGNERHSKTVVI